MTHYLLYLLKVAVAIAVFYAVFHLLFRNRKQFVFNRAYLLFSFAASFLIPLLTFKTGLVLSAGPLDLTSVIYKAAEPLEPGSPSKSNFNYNHLLLIAYWVGVVLSLSRLAYAFLRAKSIINHCEKAQIEEWSLLVSPEKIRAFTFLDKIIIGSNIVNNPSLPMILHHESVHAREKHAYDILASEMMFVALDEIIVVGYNKTGEGPANESAAYKGFTEEAQRVAQAFPKLSIPEWYGKDLKIQLKFILQ